MVPKLEEFMAEFTNRAMRSILWRHPYFELVGSRPTLPMLQNWAIQAGMIDEIFAEILTAMLGNPAIRSGAHPALLQNLADEQGHGNPVQEHFTLFKAVLEMLDISEDMYRRAVPLPGTAVILNGLRNSVSGPDPLRSLAVMASEELICPYEFPILVTAMEKVGSSANKDWRPYFSVHCELDPGHSTDLLRHLHSEIEEKEGRVERAFACQNEDLYWNLAFYDSLMLQHLMQI
jgi:hypothetical protein